MQQISNFSRVEQRRPAPDQTRRDALREFWWRPGFVDTDKDCRGTRWGAPKAPTPATKHQPVIGLDAARSSCQGKKIGHLAGACIRGTHWRQIKWA